MLLDTIGCKTKGPSPGTGYLPSIGVKKTAQKKSQNNACYHHCSW